jgi:DNA-binding response OmpR family regulator/DNA-binding CsgD family transcriptional regulator
MPDMSRRDIVLVVDDSPETLSFLTDALEEAGMTVLVAVGGSSAIELVGRITPDVILLDAVMPGLDGFETCRRLKRIKELAHVPVVFMTGLSETEHIVRGLEAGGVDYVTKPIAPEELIARIKVHLANARLAQSARIALDAAGRSLLATTRTGQVLWSTPQAGNLLGALPSSADVEALSLPVDLQVWLQRHHDGAMQADDTLSVPTGSDGRQLILSFVGQIGSNEYLFRLSESETLPDEQVLKQRLPITLREAEVLLWIARGKANRDIAEILGLSPRTVNKHLEQIFAKLGVENRTSAATLAIRTLDER